MDGTREHGYLYGGHDRLVLHVHGKGGNHYENLFLWDLASAYDKIGLSLACFSNRGANYLMESYRSDRLIFTGAAIEDSVDSASDIGSAIIALSEAGYEVPVVQGHSFGCDKVARFARDRCAGQRETLVLLSPADSWANFRAFMDRRGTNPMMTTLKPGAHTVSWSERLAENFYGVVMRDGDWYPVPIGNRTGELTENALTALTQGGVVGNPTIVYLGGEDQLQLEDPFDWVARLGAVFVDLRLVFDPNSNHQLGPHLSRTATLIAEAVSHSLDES